ncbi:hypothetical protein [Streptomyces albipurpureus]|uniref:Uncharacterized protein n=1 Tax=Streptomyces albipurpureus TaxID=2897419 RepID=A0ABT0UTL0_9ACTN|nr:hypothetical protein [Streptomyces sp. CWNU-1]MCM2390566.1 hypothetical protein [Streptomyces sp. CWNU-1]
MDEYGETPANSLEAWADGVVARLDVHEDIDRSLLYALRKGPSLRDETAARMADALRAAALGLNSAGCAMAAGVSERLLLNWQSQDPSFAAAMAAATDMARAQTAGLAGPLNPAALRVLLRALRNGALHGPAAALVGMSGRALYRLRRESPEVAALVAAARRARPKKADRRRRSPYEQRYRLIRLDQGVEVGAVRDSRHAGPGTGHSLRVCAEESEAPQCDGGDPGRPSG